MKVKLDNDKFDTMLVTSDWRYSASIVGLLKYFKYFLQRNITISYEYKEDYIKYNSCDITEERYLEFVEYHYGDRLHHVKVENLLENDEFTEEDIKKINEKLTANKIMKNTFGKIKFTGDNKELIKEIIQKNRTNLIRETYKNKLDMYKNYANNNNLFKTTQKCCRLNGYYIDMPKKGKSQGYNFNMNTFVYEDEVEFDFIPFAFIGEREAFFINDNMTVKDLFKTNMQLQKFVEDDLINSTGNKDVRRILFKSIIEMTDFIDFDVEVIYKNRDNGYFETLILVKKAINILKSIKDYKVFCFSLKVNENYYINVQKEVINSILNNILLDVLIEMFLKNEVKTKRNNSYLIKSLIDINILLKGGNMNRSMFVARDCAKKVVKKIDKNKISSYRQKLTSAIVFKDYDRVCQILLQLSNYSDVGFEFAYDLFENFEDNKEIAYTFINSLRKESEVNKDEK